PAAREKDGSPITGLVRAQIIAPDLSRTRSLGDRDHLPYKPIGATSPENVLTVRTARLDAPAEVPNSSWKFTDDGSGIAIDHGFEPGRIYEAVYRSRDPRVVGCGLAGTRDLVSFLRSDATAMNPLAASGRPAIRRTIGLGVSQSGRFLRHFVWQGFNEDE